MRFKDVEQMRVSTLKRFVRLPRFDEHLELHRLDCLSSHRNLQSFEFVQRFLAETPPEQVQPPRLLTGDDLQQMGYRPGPLYSEILHSLEDAQLEGRVRDKEGAAEYVRKRFGQPARKIKGFGA
jgi:poly(A) polymerase